MREEIRRLRHEKEALCARLNTHLIVCTGLAPTVITNYHMPGFGT